MTIENKIHSRPQADLAKGTEWFPVPLSFYIYTRLKLNMFWNCVKGCNVYGQLSSTSVYKFTSWSHVAER